MTDSLDAFFALTGTTDIPEAIERDQWGRPLILQPDGSKVAYTRASTLAGTLDNKTGLHIWDNRNIARGLAVRPDLAAAVAALPSMTGNRRKDAVTSASFNEYLDAAREVAQAHEKANWGSATHGFTEPGMRGNPAVPERIQADVDSYWARLEEYGIVNVASEIFVVNHDLKTAGTFDDLYWVPGFGLCLGDKKTGKKKIHSVLIQMATYAGSEAYDIATGKSTPLVDIVDWAALGFKERPVSDVNRKWAFFVHIPLGEGVTTFYKADLELGMQAARTAAWVRDFQKQQEGIVWDAHNEIIAGRRVQECVRLMEQAQSLEEMRDIANSFRDVWSDRLTQYGRELLAKAGA